MKHTLKVYKGTALHAEYIKSRFDKTNVDKSFPLDGHRWAYQHTTFDDNGDYDLIYRFDDHTDEEENRTVDELSARDYFAGLAMQGMLANPEWNHWSSQNHAEYAYGVADEMLKARNKPAA